MSDGTLPNRLPRPEGELEALQRAWAPPKGWRLLSAVNNTHVGPAYLAGYRWALAHPHGFTHVLQMDADFSHDPRVLPQLVHRCQGPEGADVAVGSRWVPGGGVQDWPWHRRLVSRGGSLYARTVLGVPIRDLTAGFKSCLA